MEGCERKGYLSLPDWDKLYVDVYLAFQHKHWHLVKVFWLPCSSISRQLFQLGNTDLEGLLFLAAQPVSIPVWISAVLV